MYSYQIHINHVYKTELNIQQFPYQTHNGYTNIFYFPNNFFSFTDYLLAFVSNFDIKHCTAFSQQKLKHFLSGKISNSKHIHMQKDLPLRQYIYVYDISEDLIIQRLYYWIFLFLSPSLPLSSFLSFYFLLQGFCYMNHILSQTPSSFISHQSVCT